MAPIKSDSEHYPPEGKLRVYRSRTGGNERRDFIRFFADGQDLSHVSPDDPLPESVATGAAPFRIIGAMAGG